MKSKVTTVQSYFGLLLPVKSPEFLLKVLYIRLACAVCRSPKSQWKGTWAITLHQHTPQLSRPTAGR